MRVMSEALTLGVQATAGYVIATHVRGCGSAGASSEEARRRRRCRAVAVSTWALLAAAGRAPMANGAAWRAKFGPVVCHSLRRDVYGMPFAFMFVDSSFTRDRELWCGRTVGRVSFARCG